ncbi:hypothetical protein K438DRAFT_1979397 [Mycena galopus ATCC 62051]|nr:hypothetical protein K438DRAFT_1979397 [Mycena galopus ATCC 62051]
MPSRLALGALPLLTLGANAYIWPSAQLDALEAARFGQTGYNSPAVPVSELLPNQRAIRRLRPDIGDAFSNTMNTVPLLLCRYISSNPLSPLFTSTIVHLDHLRPVTDSIALLATVAVENWYAEPLRTWSVLELQLECGGPEIALRGGRADAAVANAPGGFTPTEMIGRVACGHTFGGVQRSFFPDIVNVLNDTGDTDDVAHFHTTYFTFDNNCGATEYIADTTQNPLAVGFNGTTNSDGRIFESDGNATMHREITDCSKPIMDLTDHLYARMLDTVPYDVELSDVITPMPVKPDNAVLTMDGDVLRLSGQAAMHRCL